MTCADAFTLIAALGPFAFVAGLLAGYRHPHLGRTRRDQ